MNFVVIRVTAVGRCLSALAAASAPRSASSPGASGAPRPSTPASTPGSPPCCPGSGRSSTCTRRGRGSIIAASPHTRLNNNSINIYDFLLLLIFFFFQGKEFCYVW